MKINQIGILKESYLKNQESFNTDGLKVYCSDLARINGVSYDKTTGFGDYWFIQTRSDTKKGKLSTGYINNKGLFSRVYN